jgi:two-component system, NtrC family, nitrogen regulation sensor histidine kinase NtrY
LIVVRADLVKRSDSRYCRIQVQDSGCGIPPELKEKLFKPYFTTKENGTGLGLSIVEHIVIDHKGEIWFDSEPGLGTTFFIDLPMGNDPASVSSKET